MRLVERRIGLLFALFLLLLAAAGLRATWLGTVKAGELKKRALTQQVENLDVPARRGIISDRRGVELAVSEDAVTVFANPFLIKNPVRVAAKLAPILRLDQGELLEKLGDREKGFVYLRRQMDPAVEEKVEKLGIEGIGTVVEPRRTYPQGALASQVIGSRGHRRLRPLRPRAVAERHAPGRQRQAPAGEGRARGAREHRRGRARARQATTCA